MIALLCATPREMSCLKGFTEKSADRYCPHGMSMIEARAGDRKLLILACGVGKVAAASATMHLIDSHPVELLINFGTAGALSPIPRIGDIVIATELIQGDVGIAHSRGFKTTGPGLCERGEIVFSPSYRTEPALVQRAEETASGNGIPYHRGKVLTCDQVVLDSKLRSHLGDRFDALAVEMEGAASAQVALGEGLPFLAIRAISDDITHDFVDLEKVLPRQGQSRLHLWGKRFLLSVTHPSAIARARDLSRGTDAALSNLAAFIEVLLERGLDA
ncbi:MAG: futalosine hydrolase [Actinomycetota bacterium]|nr:futalosine hydrolase [Actinomycetota bacterium]